MNQQNRVRSAAILTHGDADDDAICDIRNFAIRVYRSRAPGPTTERIPGTDLPT